MSVQNYKILTTLAGRPPNDSINCLTPKVSRTWYLLHQRPIYKRVSSEHGKKIDGWHCNLTRRTQLTDDEEHCLWFPNFKAVTSTDSVAFYKGGKQRYHPKPCALRQSRPRKIPTGTGLAPRARVYITSVTRNSWPRGEK